MILSEVLHVCERMNKITVHKKIALLHKVLSTLFRFLLGFFFFRKENVELNTSNLQTEATFLHKIFKEQPLHFENGLINPLETQFQFIISLCFS